MWQKESGAAGFLSGVRQRRTGLEVLTLCGQNILGGSNSSSLSYLEKNADNAKYLRGQFFVGLLTPEEERRIASPSSLFEPLRTCSWLEHTLAPRRRGLRLSGLCSFPNKPKASQSLLFLSPNKTYSIVEKREQTRKHLLSLNPLFCLPPVAQPEPVCAPGLSRRGNVSD